jgi:hypothetical protein
MPDVNNLDFIPTSVYFTERLFEYPNTEFSFVNLPEDAAPAVPAQIVSAVCSANSILLTFNAPVTVSSFAATASNWLIIPNAGSAPMTVTGIASANTDEITLTTTEATNGGGYTLYIPIGVLKDVDLTPLLPPYSIAFTGVGVPFTLAAIITSNDGYSFDLLFSKAVVEPQALDITNYIISPNLIINNITKINDSRFRATTTIAQTPGVLYTVTASNIRDLFNNLI